MAQAIAESIREVFPLSGGGGSTGCLPAYPGTLLRVGSRGESVRLMQRCLNLVAARHPSIARLNEDGVFGPLTQASVMTFQRIFGLTVDGIVGPITWDRISREAQSGGSGLPAYPGTALRVGSSGESVRQIQRCLNNIATRHPSISRLNEDGVFGPLTQASVKTFQRIFGLTVDGVVGPITWDRISRECSGTISTSTPRIDSIAMSLSNETTMLDETLDKGLDEIEQEIQMNQEEPLEVIGLSHLLILNDEL